MWTEWRNVQLHAGFGCSWDPCGYTNETHHRLAHRNAGTTDGP
jgi:hypothetical protein